MQRCCEFPHACNLMVINYAYVNLECTNLLFCYYWPGFEVYRRSLLDNALLLSWCLFMELVSFLSSSYIYNILFIFHYFLCSFLVIF